MFLSETTQSQLPACFSRVSQLRKRLSSAAGAPTKRFGGFHDSAPSLMPPHLMR